jgi:hypothetical protein
MKIPRAHIRGFTSDMLVASWSTYWFQSFEGRLDLPLRTTPIRGPDVRARRQAIFIEPLMANTNGQSKQ